MSDTAPLHLVAVYTDYLPEDRFHAYETVTARGGWLHGKLLNGKALHVPLARVRYMVEMGSKEVAQARAE